MPTDLDDRNRPPLQGAIRWMLISMGTLPFVTTVKLPPLGNFWGEWIAALVSVALLAVLNGYKRGTAEGHTNLLPLAAVPFGGLAVITAVQMTLKMPQLPASYFLPIGELCVAAALAVAGASLVRNGTWRQAMDALSLGLLIALVANFAVVLIEFSGHQIYVFEFVPRSTPPRALGLMGQPNQLAVLAVMAWTAAYYRCSTGHLNVKGYALLSLMVSIVVAASGSRGGLLCQFAAMVLALVMLGREPRTTEDKGVSDDRYRRRRAVLAWSAACFMAVQIAWILVPHGNAATTSALRGTVSPRLELLSAGWNLWLNHPFLGVGFGQFSAHRLLEISAPMFEPHAGHTHNLIINLLAEYGLVGAALCLVPLACILYATVRRLRTAHSAPELYFGSAVVLTLLIYSLLEYPFWYTYFLFPFAFVLGGLPQRVWRYPASKDIAIVRAGVWSAVGIGCFVVLADYLRLQNLYIDVSEQREASRVSGKPWLEISGQAAVISRATFFPLAADYMYARTLNADGLVMDYKRDIARRVMLGIPKPETFARYVAFSLADGDTAEADRWLKVAAACSIDMFHQVVASLRSMAVDHRAITKYLEDNGLAP